MTMYLLVFKQGQASVSSMLTAIGGMYEDNLYLSNLYEYLEQASTQREGTAVAGPEPDAGLELTDVSFTYPGARFPALRNVNLDIRSGQSVAIVGMNGSGKTTLIKLMAGLYSPASGTIRFQGRDIEDWDPAHLRTAFGIIFQDFNRYQLKVGENIGAGVLILDEPTASMDAQSEADIFDHFQSMTAGKIAILISHRFSTVRRAEQIIVMDDGKVVETGSHENLLNLNGIYA